MKPEMENAIAFPHNFDGLQAVWGYSLDYEDEGLMVYEIETGAEVHWFPHDDLIPALERFGSYGIWKLIFQGKEWEKVPSLAEFAKTYRAGAVEIQKAVGDDDCTKQKGE